MKKKLLRAEKDYTVKTLGLDWHSVSDCFQNRCMGKLDSMKPNGMPQGTTNLIKSEKASNVDFDTIPVVAGKVKKVANFSPPMTRKKEPLKIRKLCIRTSADAQLFKYFFANDQSI